MKKQLINLFTMIMSVTAITSTDLHAQTLLKMHVLDACTGQAVPDNTHLTFSTGAVGSPFGYAKDCYVTGGYAYYSAAVPDPIGCGHVSAIDGTLVSTSITNYWCPGSYPTTTNMDVILNFPNSTSFTINSAPVSTTAGAPTNLYFCPSPTMLLNNNSQGRGEISQYNLTIYNSLGAVYKTTGWVVGASPVSIDLKSSAYFGATPPNGNYSISLKNIFCSGATQEYKAYVTTNIINASVVDYKFTYSLGPSGLVTPGTSYATAPAVGGLIGINGAYATTSNISAYNFYIDEVDASGFVYPMYSSGNIAATTIPASLNFNSLTIFGAPAYFINNYASIIHHKYRFTMNVINPCGTVTKIGYFAIAAGCQYCKGINEDLVNSGTTTFSVTSYPNPVLEKANLVISLPSEEGIRDIKVIITDITGKIVSEKIVEVDNNITEYAVPVDLSEMNSGIYLYKVVSGTNMANGKIVKQ